MDGDLFSAIAAYGADMVGVQDRFMGDASLYALCLREFLNEPNFLLLREAIQAADWDLAFRAAHALKGLSGNMGLTPFCEVIYPLVENLRSGQCDTAAKEYEDVMAAKRAVAEAVQDALTDLRGEVDAFEY